jgi:hypothetical protein
MNNGQRKLIRDHIKTVIAAAAISDIQLFTFKKSNLDGEKAAVCIYMENGDYEQLGYDSTLTVRVMAPDQQNVDDVLDAIGDQIQNTLNQDITLAGTCRFITLKGYEYDRESTQAWTALDMQYGVVH